MNQSPEQGRDFLATHPPRCLAGFETHPVRIKRGLFGRHHDDLRTEFHVTCKCGHSRHFVLGHYWRNPDFKNELVFVGPLALRCESCNQVTELIDTDIHGHDGEIGGSATHRGEGDRDTFKCRKCNEQPFSISVRFDYHEELFTEEFADYHGREQDLFTSFELLGTCAACTRQRQITAFECA